jgi:hypothetical protein
MAAQVPPAGKFHQQTDVLNSSQQRMAEPIRLGLSARGEIAHAETGDIDALAKSLADSR